MTTKILSSLSLAALLACSPEAPQTDLALLQQQRDSIALLASGLDDKISQLDLLIAAKDSNSNLSTVTTTPPMVGAFSHSFKAFGSVHSDQSVSLYPEMGGSITDIHVRGGQRVKAGDLLLSVDNAMILASLAGVKSQLALAEALYIKQSSLWEKGIGSEVQFLQAKTNQASLQAQLNSVNEQLQMTEMVAPFAGTVEEVMANAGEFAMPGQPLIRLVSQSGLRLDLHVPESYISKLHVNNLAVMHFDALGKVIEGRISQVGGFINPGSRTFRVSVTLPQSRDFKPNMMASVDLFDYAVDSALFIPSRLVLQNTEGDDFTYVYQANGLSGLVVKRALSIGVSNANHTEILSGLKPGDQLIDKGIRSVQNGQRVKQLTSK